MSFCSLIGCNCASTPGPQGPPGPEGPQGPVGPTGGDIQVRNVFTGTFTTPQTVEIDFGKLTRYDLFGTMRWVGTSPSPTATFSTEWSLNGFDWFILENPLFLSPPGGTGTPSSAGVYPVVSVYTSTTIRYLRLHMFPTSPNNLGDVDLYAHYV